MVTDNGAGSNPAAVTDYLTDVYEKRLGPFTYALWNPVAYRSGGFAEGVGHGSTVQGDHGNWFNSGTSWIGYNWGMEPRIAIYPARFHPDGQFNASTRFGAWPRLVSTGQFDDPDSLFAGWMLRRTPIVGVRTDVRRHSALGKSVSELSSPAVNTTLLDACTTNDHAAAFLVALKTDGQDLSLWSCK